MTQCFCSCQFEKFKKKQGNIYKGVEANTREKNVWGHCDRWYAKYLTYLKKKKILAEDNSCSLQYINKINMVM